MRERERPGDIVVVQMESYDLVERPQCRGGDEVQLVVSDGEELQVPLQPSEGLAVNVSDLVVVQRQGSQPWEALEVPSCEAS